MAVRPHEETGGAGSSRDHAAHNDGNREELRTELEKAADNQGDQAEVVQLPLVHGKPRWCLGRSTPDRGAGGACGVYTPRRHLRLVADPRHGAVACPTCRGAMRLVVFLTEASVIDQWSPDASQAQINGRVRRHAKSPVDPQTGWTGADAPTTCGGRSPSAVVPSGLTFRCSRRAFSFRPAHESMRFTAGKCMGLAMGGGHRDDCHGGGGQIVLVHRMAQTPGTARQGEQTRAPL